MFSGTPRTWLAIAGASASIAFSTSARASLLSSFDLSLLEGAVEAAAAAADGGAKKPCTAEAHPAGEWASHGHDLANTRSQPLEDLIGPGNVASLEQAWLFDTGVASGTLNGTLGEFNGTPIVDGGCAFVGSASGSLYALDAETGKPVWQRQVDVPAQGLGGTFVASLAISKKLVVALVNELGGPHAIGLDRSTGEVKWTSERVHTYPESYTNANPVIYDDLLVFGFSAPEGDPEGQGGFAVIDTRDGRLLARTWTIPEEDQGEYAGGGVWTAPAVDEEEGFAYIGTGNPYSKQVEHERTNAILKADLRRKSPTFGQVVASYKGQIDQYNETLLRASRPTCGLLGEDRTINDAGELLADTFEPIDGFQGFLADSQACLQLDFGFGAGVNLFTAPDGRRMVGGLQKSGVYHAASRKDMGGTWQTVLGAPCNVCSGSSPAYDGEETIFTAVAPGTLMRSLSTNRGEVGWTAPILDGVHYQSVSHANGVVYSVDTLGFLDVFDARTGNMLDSRPLFLEAGEDTVSLAASGVAIARNTVYVSVGSQVVAYRLPSAYP